METTPAGLKKTIFEQIRERFFYSSQATGITVVACFVLALILWRLMGFCGGKVASDYLRALPV